jgi:hypothetical protein
MTTFALSRRLLMSSPSGRAMLIAQNRLTARELANALSMAYRQLGLTHLAQVAA